LSLLENQESTLKMNVTLLNVSDISGTGAFEAQQT
jgi:hypothetical protein